MTEFKNITEWFILVNMQGLIGRKWYGYDPTTLKMIDYKIAPLGHELTTMDEREHGDVWRNWVSQ